MAARNVDSDISGFMISTGDTGGTQGFLPFDCAKEMQKALCVHVLAERLHLSTDRVLALAEAGDIPSQKVGDRWFFGVASINLWLEGRSLEESVRSAVQSAVESRVFSETGGIRFALERPYTLEALENAYILHVLKSVDGNRTIASERLGIDPSTLYRKPARIDDT